MGNIATITLIIHHGTRVQPGLVLMYVPCNTALIISLYTLSLDWSVVESVEPLEYFQLFRRFKMYRCSLRSMCEGQGMMQISTANCTHYTRIPGLAIITACQTQCGPPCPGHSSSSETAHCGHLSRVPHAMCGLEWTVDTVQVNN